MILVTGGAGYIGSHTCLELILAGMQPVVVDNFSNSSNQALLEIERFTGHKIPVVEGDVRDKALLEQLFQYFTFDSVIHLAGLKVMADSIINPLGYFDNNVTGTTTLCQVMSDAACKKLVFSSSASVYADSTGHALTESSPLLAQNPYSRSKYMAENILHSLHQSDDEWKISILRYFNPVGAHDSGLIGESPKTTATTLIPAIIDVATTKKRYLNVFGDDYNTHDGTAIRDYLHIQDLAKAHLAALKKLSDEQSELETYNIGTGTGYSVLEMIENFEQATGLSVPYRVKPRREHEVAFSLANPSLALAKLGWQAELDIKQMCLDSWLWATKQYA